MTFRNALLPRAVLLAPAAAALAAASACSRGPAAPHAPPPAPVTVAHAIARDVPVVLPAIGTVEARESVEVRSRAGGEITGVHFTEGEDVRRGDLLFTIDRRPYEAALAEAEAALARETAIAKHAESDAQRFEELAKKDWVTKGERDAVVARSASARASVAAEQAAVDEARLRLAWTSVRAPIGGRAGRVLARTGNLVRAEDPDPLVVLHRSVPMDVSFTVPERHLPEIRRRFEAGEELRVEAVARGEAGIDPAPGRLHFVDNAVDRATGTILLKAEFPNEDRRFWPGQFADVKLVLQTREDAVVVPSSAVQTGQEGSFVWVVGPDAAAAMRPVVTEGEVEGPAGRESVIREGVEAGEVVVTDGAIRLFPGAKVEVHAGAPAAATAAGGTGAAPETSGEARRP